VGTYARIGNCGLSFNAIIRNVLTRVLLHGFNMFVGCG